ncbi:carbohydrate kinase [Catenovulum sp. 2E275]|uniref:carbohydrate kinase family protein n=1 Tax=Catenovulum sp. 2E275 TaxID=2980497 RepID=UPI0021D2B2C8|nr:carbohydrate kinase [Catenovulum sp. 2E275]MCU4675707.1 carbohydrate kinase [Catenovulum sp. 2E275]
MKVISVGEAIIDMMSVQADDNDNQNMYKACAGGAPANVAVAVAKLGGDSRLVGKVGEDQFGKFLRSELTRFKVNIDCLNTAKDKKTAMALVSFDHNRERSFDFYLENAAHTYIELADFNADLFSEQSLFHFCSGSVASPELESITNAVIEKIKATQGLISLDINYRHAFWQNPNTAAPKINQLAKQADIIKASREEIEVLYGATNVDSTIQNWVNQGSLVLLTDGSKPVEFISTQFKGTYPTPKVTPVDTTAAGDSFIGGFLFFACQKASNTDGLSQWLNLFENVIEAVNFAARCGAYTVTQVGSFIALPQLEDLNTAKTN